MTTYGLAGFGYALGDPVDPATLPPATTDARLRKSLRAAGWHRLYRARAETGLTDLAVLAGSRALAAAGVTAAELDVVVLAITDIAEHLYWDPAAAVAARLGAHQAEVLLLTQACTSGLQAFDIVGGKLATRPDYRVALMVAANRVCETYYDRLTSNTAIGSDGAAATVAIRDHQSCRWLGTEVVTDGRYADYFRMESGGAAVPFGPDEPVRPIASPFDRLERMFGEDSAAMARFAGQVAAGVGVALHRVAERAGIPVSAVRWLLHINDSRQAIAEVARTLDFPLTRTNARLAAEHGHLGTADPLLSLRCALADGDVVPGDVVALTGVGSGMHWAATLLQV